MSGFGENVLRTDVQTDRAEFIGSLRQRQGSKNEFEI